MANQQDKSVLLYDGVSAPTIVVQEGSSAASYEIGDLVKFDSGGQIILATNGLIAGIAQMDATASAGAAGDVQFMELINYNALYLICNTSTADQADVGETSAIVFTAGAHTVAAGTTSAGEVHIVGIYPGDLGVSGGRNIVRFSTFDATEIGD